MYVVDPRHYSHFEFQPLLTRPYKEGTVYEMKREERRRGPERGFVSAWVPEYERGQKT